LPANALCQAMPMVLGDCVRQQAGSYGRRALVIRHPSQIVGARLPANAFCQSMQMALGDCVRQQAGSYGRRALVIRHPSQIVGARLPSMRCVRQR
jgi:hypothetical protein